ncbi:hypothetical protein MOJ79_13145 [Calidifontimicrobium sp. SYSU G02091]|uniref:hypothetical protein n=1 Tax=Calidifontimicrobium sp. SYSU G02091 TaxID=2926421 RepID=UPI001F53B0D5|nr:hypothetical protein [Calidifontimicrobium sp. SYSU G02091]MCI1192786.1 hypothetical protein [Calidifontimicrobium sp. SYSU G02091]
MNRPPRIGRLAIALLALALSACASTAPVLYSKKSDSVVLDERARRDIAECSRLADARVGRNGLQGEAVARQAAAAGTVGFVATAVGSLVGGAREVWERARGAAAGGATGVATKLLLDWNQGDEVYQGYVERCLAARGHDVLGWR